MEDKPFQVLLQKLTDIQGRWIQLAQASPEEIMDAFLLEQFLIDLEENTHRWVQQHHPKTLQEALQLAEDFDCAQNETPREKGDKLGASVSTRSSERQGDREGRMPSQVPLLGSTCFHCRKRGHFA